QLIAKRVLRKHDVDHDVDDNRRPARSHYLRGNRRESSMTVYCARPNGGRMNRRTALLLGAASAAISGSGQARAASSPARGVRAREPFIDRPNGTRLSLMDWGSGEPLLFV